MIIDVHSHILPGCDHGSDSVSTSVAQVKRALEAGVQAIHLSSHYYYHDESIDEFIERRNFCYNELMKALDEETKSKIKFVLGAEVTLEVGLSALDDLPKLCIGDTDNILVEMPRIAWTDWTYNALYDISVRHKLRPLIAHIDRYDEKQWQSLFDMDLNIQVNASAFNILFMRRKLKRLFREGACHVIGSDVHGKRAKEYDFYEKAINFLGDETSWIMDNAKRFLGL